MVNLVYRILFLRSQQCRSVNCKVMNSKTILTPHQIKHINLKLIQSIHGGGNAPPSLRHSQHHAETSKA